jgi:hypothetical protein
MHATCFSQSSLKDEESPAVHIDDPLFSETLASFRRLLNAIEIGTTLIDYRRELLDAKTELDPLISLFPKSQQRTDIEEATRDYMIAADVWQIGIQYGDGIPTKTDFYRSLRARYELKVEPKVGRKINEDAMLHFIWGVAAARIERAIKLQTATR